MVWETEKYYSNTEEIKDLKNGIHPAESYWDYTNAFINFTHPHLFVIYTPLLYVYSLFSIC